MLKWKLTSVLPSLLSIVMVLLLINPAEAARLGRGRSIGRQAPVATPRTPPPSTPQQPAGAQQQAQPRPAQAAPQPAPQAAQAPQPPRNRWLGPIAGLAAGIGLAALLSHFGLAGAAANMLSSFLLIILVLGIVVWLINRFRSRAQPAYANASASGGSWKEPMGSAAYAQNFSSPEPVQNNFATTASSVNEPVHTELAQTVVPANFDTEAFLRSAKVSFIRLQASWDAGNIDDIRVFTTPEMFAEIKMDLQDRGTQTNKTDVVQLNAELAHFENQTHMTIVSVKFSGLIKENPAEAPKPFIEIWTITREPNESGPWLLAGIQQIEN